MDRDSSSADLGVVHAGHGLPPDAPVPDVREVQQTFIDHWFEIIADVSVIQLLPPSLAVEVRNASEGSRPFVAERLVQQYLTGPEPLHAALQSFLAHCSKGIVPYGSSSELSLFDHDMPAVDHRFVGREDHLREIADNFLSPKPRSVVIRGVPGIGKTTLASKAVADSRLDELYNVVWVSSVDARTVDDLKRCLSRASQLSHLKHPAAGRSTDLRGLITADNQSAQVCRPSSKRLLIVLNRTDKLAETYRRSSGLASFLAWLEEHLVFRRPRLLITMVGECDLGIDSFDIDLGRLVPDEAEVLFTSFRWTSRWSDAPNLWNVVNRFAGHPLALTIAARAAPRNGDLETFVQLLQRHRPSEEDELDAAIKLLLLDSSQQEPKLRQLLRFVAYWPRDCELEVICAIIDVPDAHTAIILADPAAKLGILELIRWSSDLGLHGLFYRMSRPFKDRLNRIDPITEYEVRRTHDFVFKQVFHDSKWELWVNNPLDPLSGHFTNLDAIFLDAFQAPDPAVATSALDAVLSIPRRWCSWLHPRKLIHRTSYDHQLRLDTLRQASACAIRLGDSRRQASLELRAVEYAVEHFAETGGSRPKAKLEPDLHSLFESLIERSDGDPELGRRKCSYLMGYLALSRVSGACGEERSSYLKQARQYLYMEDLELGPDALHDAHGRHLSASGVNSLLDATSIHLLRFHLHLQCDAPEDAYRAYLATLVSFDDAFAGDLHQCVSYYCRPMIQLDAAALFAARGALEYASKVVDLSLSSQPLPCPWPSRLQGWFPCVHTISLFRHYLADHKDARSWRELLLANIGGEPNFMLKYYLFQSLHTFPRQDNRYYLVCCAERAVLAFSIRGLIKYPYQTWLLGFCAWDSATFGEILSTSWTCIAGLVASMVDFQDNRPCSESLAALRASLPLPRPENVAGYRHHYAALSAIVEGNFVGAASEFFALEATYVQGLSTWTDMWWPEAEVFPLEIRLSVFKSLFRALAEDCLKQHNTTPALIRDVVGEGADEPVAIADGWHGLYIQFIMFVLVWIASCLPDISRVLQ